VTGPAVVRPPRGAELAACRALLPGSFAAGMPEARVAVVESPYRLLGAATLAEYAGRDGAIGWDVALRVVKPERRQGVGTRLVEALAEAAASRSVSALRVRAEPSEHPEAGPFLLAAGFARRERRFHFEADLSATREILGAYIDRMREEGWIPPEARVVPLCEAPLEGFARLMEEHFRHGNEAEDVLGRWRLRLERDEITHSPAVLVGETPAALLVGENPSGDCFRVLAEVVAPAYRKSWASALLLSAAADTALRMGGRTYRFDCTPDERDTIRNARRFGARTTRTVDTYERGLGPR
jgi:GNAT superfamily N-acetyltransferase